MFNFNKNKSGGFIKALFIVIIAIMILSFFVDLKSLIESKRLKDNYQYLKTLSISLWANYISAGAHYIWNKLIIKYIYKDVFMDFIWPKVRLKTP